jgi:hypothetical protein
MNQFLEDESYWSLSSKQRALQEFDDRIVTAF